MKSFNIITETLDETPLILTYIFNYVFPVLIFNVKFSVLLVPVLMTFVKNDLVSVLFFRVSFISAVPNNKDDTVMPLLWQRQ